MSKSKILLGIEICDPTVRNVFGMPAKTYVGIENCWCKGHSWSTRRLKKAVKTRIEAHQFVLIRNGGGYIKTPETPNQRNIHNRFKKWIGQD